MAAITTHLRPGGVSSAPRNGQIADRGAKACWQAARLATSDLLSYAQFERWCVDVARRKRLTDRV
jgi:hypothetical protein